MDKGSKGRERKHYITLNFKLALVVVIALIMTFLVFELLNWMQGIVAQKYYLSDEAIEKNVDEEYINFINFIDRGNIKSSDTEQIQNWVKDHEYTYLKISDNYSVAFDGGWSVASTPSPATDVTEDQSEVPFNNENDRITPDTFEQDIKNRIIQFDDGLYYVYINVYKEENFYRAMFFAKTIICVVTLIGILLGYNGRVLGRVTKLSAEVEEVTRGNLTASIDSTANDEIGKLADNVESMRDYIIRRLRSEKEAWDKNSELITAMSHDIRTPLTSLMGYLDIIESGKYETEEEKRRYIASCQEKAVQLKELSDKLFQYFLVFGSQGVDKDYEVYDADILLQQIITEHSAELINYGFNINFEYLVPEGTEIKIDISGLRRLFDNLFSNIMKYADKTAPVRISAMLDEEDGTIDIRIINGVLTESRKVESNKIGLKTCEKICDDMGGAFEYKDEGQIFTVQANIPIYKEKPQEGGGTSDDTVDMDIHDIDIHNVEEILGEDIMNLVEEDPQPHS